MSTVAKGDSPEGAPEPTRADDGAPTAAASGSVPSQVAAPDSAAPDPAAPGAGDSEAAAYDRVASDPAASWADDSEAPASAAATASAAAAAPNSARPAAGAAGTSAPARRKGGGFRAVLWTLIVVAILAAAAWFTQPQWRPLLAGAFPGLIPPEAASAASQADLSKLDRDLQARIDALEAALTTLKSETTEAEQRLAATTARLEQMPAATAPAGGEAAAAASAPQPFLERAEAMEQRVESVARRIDTLEQRTGGIDRRVQGAEQRGDALAQRLEAQDQELSQVLKSVGNTESLAPRVEALEKDSLQAKRLADSLRELRETAVVTRDEAASLHLAVLAANQLAVAVNRSGPFVAELQALQAVAPERARPTLEALSPYAATGVLTVETLKARFPAVARTVAGTKAALAGETWTERTLNRLTQLVSIRKTGPEAIAAGGVDGRLAEAEQVLAKGDLAAAVKALEGLDTKAAAEAAAPWIEAAKARLAVDQALVALQASILPQPAASRS